MAGHFKFLGEYLKQKRIEAGFSQMELARRLENVHNQFISNWERGLCAPPAHSFESLLELLEVDREELIEEMLKDSRAEIEAILYKGKRKKKKTTARKKKK